MNSNDIIETHPVSYVVAILSLGVMAITLTLTCTWMTNRKRRVANHVTSKHGHLVLEAPPSRTSRSNTMTAGQPKYTSTLRLSHHGTLIHPAIIITPPTPLALLPMNPSLMDSDSSIGSAEDLMMDTSDLSSSENPDIMNDIPAESNFCGDSLDGEINAKEKRMLKEIRIRELKCKTSVFSDMVDFDHRIIHRPKGTTSLPLNHNANTSIVNYNHLHDVTQTEMTSTKINATSSSSFDQDGNSDSVSVIIDNDLISTNDISEGLIISPRSPRPRLGSIEPGTTRPQIYRQQLVGDPS